MSRDVIIFVVGYHVGLVVSLAMDFIIYLRNKRKGGE